MRMHAFVSAPLRPSALSAPLRFNWNARRRSRAFTLLEMLLAIGLLLLLTSAMYTFYWMALDVRQRGTRRVEGTQLARVIAQRIANEIRGSGAVLNTLGAGIIGTEHEITLNTVVLPDQDLLLRRRGLTDKPIPAQSDIREIRYYLGYDPDDEIEYPEAGRSGGRNLGLVRREIKTLHQASVRSDHREEVDTDLFAPEITYIRFRYFDGVDWLKKWQLSAVLPEQNALPQAVEVIVGYDPPVPPPDPEEEEAEEDTDVNVYSDPEPYSTSKFSVVVRLPTADAFFGSRLMRAGNELRGSGIGGSGLGEGFGE